MLRCTPRRRGKFTGLQRICASRFFLFTLPLRFAILLASTKHYAPNAITSLLPAAYLGGSCWSAKARSARMLHLATRTGFVVLERHSGARGSGGGARRASLAFRHAYLLPPGSARSALRERRCFRGAAILGAFAAGRAFCTRHVFLPRVPAALSAAKSAAAAGVSSKAGGIRRDPLFFTGMLGNSGFWRTGGV